MRKSRKDLPEMAAVERLHRQKTRNWKEEFKYDAVRGVDAARRVACSGVACSAEGRAQGMRRARAGAGCDWWGV
jgi:hypothetical protein